MFLFRERRVSLRHFAERFLFENVDEIVGLDAESPASRDFDIGFLGLLLADLETQLTASGLG